MRGGISQKQREACVKEIATRLIWDYDKERPLNCAEKIMAAIERILK